MQSRKHSIAETVLNTLSGFIISWVMTLIVLPWFGSNITAGQGFIITVIYTIVSVIRSYFWRRLFNRLHKKGIL